VLEDLARVDLNAELIADKFNGGANAAAEPTSNLEQLIFTLSRCVSVLRRKGDFVSGGHFPDLTEHEMCRLAKVPCFRANCAECRKNRRTYVDPTINVSRELAHATEENPF
jgi:hypothetical protein